MKKVNFEFNDKIYVLSVSDGVYEWLLEEERHIFIWTKTDKYLNYDWTISEKNKSKSANLGWFKNKPTPCDCPEVEIEYQKYFRELKLGRILND